MRRLFILGVVLSFFTLISCQRIQKNEELSDVDSMSSSSVFYADTGVTEFSEIVTKTAPVETRELRQFVYASTPVRGVSEAVVRSAVPGTIERIDFGLGDRVQEGQVLLVLDNTVAALTVDQLEGQRNILLRDLEVQNILHERGAVSFSELAQTESSLKNIETQLAVSSETLADMEVKTPIKGHIGYKDDTLVIGGKVSAGQIIARVVDIERIKLIFSVGESQLFQIRTGAAAHITISTLYRDYEIDGNVRAVSASSDESTGAWQIIVEAENPDPEIIRAGVSADIAVRNSGAPSESVIPNAAMVYRDGRTYVYVLESEKTALLLEVNVKDSYGDYTAVEPVDPSMDLTGRSVLVTRLDTIRNGDQVVTR